MGVKLMHFFDEAKQLGGLKAQMRLAVLTNTPSPKAQTCSDSPDLIEKFTKALDEIRKEFR